MPHFLRYDGKYVQHSDHYFYDHLGHCVCRSHGGIRLEALEDLLDTLEQIDDDIVAENTITVL